jgi:hypothetical protein
LLFQKIFTEEGMSLFLTFFIIGTVFA